MCSLRRSLVALLLAGLWPHCGATPLHAASEASLFDLSLEQLAKVVVTETKIPQPKETATPKMETLYRVDIDRTPIACGNLAEYLRHIAGQFVNPLSRNDANWGSYAGLGPKYNTFLLDGVPIDSFADAMSLDPWVLDSIEVYKGPASVLYSNYLTMDFAGNEMSLAGITNFLLKDHIDSAATRIAFEGGSYDTFRTRLFHQNRNGNVSYFAGASFEHSNYTDYGTADSWLGMLDSPRYDKAKYYARVSVTSDGERQKLSIFAHRTDHHGRTGRPHRGYDYHYDTVNASFQRKIDADWSLQIKAGFRGYDREWEEDNYPVSLDLVERNGVKQRIFLSDIAAHYQHAGRSLLTFGADYQRAGYETHTVLNDVDAVSQGVFFQEKYVFDRWVFRVGGRANRTEHTYNKINAEQPLLKKQDWESGVWSTGIRFNASPSLSFYGNLGNSFLVPSAKSVCGTIPADDAFRPGKNGQLPNNELGTEKGIGADVGADASLQHGFSLGFRGFLNTIDNAIVENVVSTTPSQSRSVNAGEVRSHGFELTLEQSVSSKLKWRANLTRTVSDVGNETDPDQDGTHVSFVPNWVANIGLTVLLPGAFELSPRLQYVGSYFDSTSRRSRSEFGRYALADVKLQSPFWRCGAGTLRAALEVNNVFDREIALPWQFRNPGRDFFISIEIAF